MKDFLIQTIFNQVIKESEIKLASSQNPLQDNDPQYDLLLRSLGSLAKHNPKLIIDSLMIWRKSHASTTQTITIILVRILIEIVLNVNMAQHAELSVKLEEMIFNQILANSNDFFLFSELLGHLSLSRFDSIKRKYISIIDSNTTNELRLEILLKSMKFIRFKVYPEKDLDETVDFIRYISEFYRDSFSSNLKVIYSELIIHMLTPLSPIVVAEVNIPDWMKACENIYQKSQKMISKGRSHGFLLATTILCISKRDFFLQKWTSLLETMFQKLKDKTLRNTLLLCLCRLVWTYLYRCTEAITTTHGKLDQIVKILFPAKKVYPPEASLEYFSMIILFILGKHWDYGFKLIWSLLNGDSLLNTIDLLSSERVSTGLRAFVGYLSTTNLLKGADLQKPPFPWDAEKYPSGMVYPVVELYSCNIKYTIDTLLSLNGKHAEAVTRVNSILGKILKLLDIQSCSYLLTDEKFSAFSSRGSTFSGTSSSGTFTSTSFSYEAMQISRDKSPYFEALKTLISSLPRLYPDMDDSDLMDILCKYLTHVDPDVATAAQEAFLRIAKLIPAKQSVIIKSFTSFLVNMSDKYPEILEKCLKDYVALCKIWLNYLEESQIENKQKNLDSAPSQSILLWGKMQEFESTGLLFLCNPVHTIRIQAIEVLKLSAKLYTTFLVTRNVSDDSHSRTVSITSNSSIQHPYILKILQTSGELILKRHKNDYSYNIEPYLTECNNSDFIVNLASSESPPDQHLWTKCFPDMVKLCFDFCPSVAHICLENICYRLLGIHQFVVTAADPSKIQNATLTSKFSLRQTTPATDEMVERWKFYLMFACGCITTSDPTLKKSRKPIKSLSTAQEIFQLVIPLLVSEKTSIRLAVVMAFGHVNWVVYKDLIEELEPYIKSILEDMRSRYIRGSLKRVKKLERLRSEITHILYLSADFVRHGGYINDEELVNFVINFIRETGAFLSDIEVQSEWDHQMLRYYFCGFVESFYRSLADLSDPSVVFPFELRYSLFKLFEEWCGYGSRGSMMRDRETAMVGTLLEQVKDSRERSALTSAMEEQRKALEFAALRAMSCLCKGPIHPPDKSKGQVSFDILSLFEWIEAIFASDDERLISIAKYGIESLLSYNDNFPEISENVISFCYQNPPDLEVTRGYFLAFCANLSRSEIRTARHRILPLLLLKLGDSLLLIRRRAFDLLQIVEERYFGECICKKFEIAILSPLSTTYKSAQHLVSSKLAEMRSELTHQILSEFFLRMEMVSSIGQRSIVNILLPWLRNVDLTLDDRFGELAQLSYLLLWNMYYCTLRYGMEIEPEIELLWAALARTSKNIATIVQFLVYMGLERRTILFATHAKKIITYIGRTPMKNKLIEILTNELSPRNMIPVKRNKKDRLNGIDIKCFYLAPLDEILNDETRRSVLSRGQLIMIFLVDFAIEQGKDLEPHLPLLLHVISVQLDHFNILARDHAKMLLISLVHSLAPDNKFEKANMIIETLKKTTDWPQGKSPLELPVELRLLVDDLLNIFSANEMNLNQSWGEYAIKWATSCPVRHIACRSLQYFQTLRTEFSQKMLADCLARLSNTIADQSEDVRGFSVEILRTLRLAFLPMSVETMMKYPQAFWMCVGCMKSHHIDEYLESITILDSFLRKIDISNEDVKEILIEMMPESWKNSFDGILPLVFKGMGHELLQSLSLSLINELTSVFPDRFIENPEIRALLTVLANVPSFMEELDKPNISESKINDANKINTFLIAKNQLPLAILIETFAAKKLRSSEEFLRQLTSILKDFYLAQYEVLIYQKLIMMLSNHRVVHREKCLKTLRSLLQQSTITDTKLDSFSTTDLEPLMRLVQTPFAQDALIILDELIKFADNSTQSVLKNLFGSKTLAKLAQDDSLSLLLDLPQWSFSETAMSRTRAEVADVLAVYANQKIKFDSSGDSRVEVRSRSSSNLLAFSDEPSEHPAANLTLEKSAMNLDEFGSFDELINTLEDLDEYFTTEDVQEESLIDNPKLDHAGTDEAEDEFDVVGQYGNLNDGALTEEEPVYTLGRSPQNSYYGEIDEDLIEKDFGTIASEASSLSDNFPLERDLEEISRPVTSTTVEQSSPTDIDVSRIFQDSNDDDLETRENMEISLETSISEDDQEKNKELVVETHWREDSVPLPPPLISPQMVSTTQDEKPSI